jgi:hypothetical protein
VSNQREVFKRGAKKVLKNKVLSGELNLTDKEIDKFPFVFNINPDSTLTMQILDHGIKSLNKETVNELSNLWKGV